jgi:hypothetical protein
MLHSGDEVLALKLTTPIRVNNARTTISTFKDIVIEGVHIEAGFHPIRERVSDIAERTRL